jgi:hypothetical protein
MVYNGKIRGYVMKPVFIIFLIMAINFSACAQGSGSNNQVKESNVRIKIEIGNNEFTAIIYENETANNFIARLPVTINMQELNGNEKYYNFPESLLNGSPQSPGTINTGDIMLWSSNCLVLFYKTFSTSYRYVKIGRIENVTGLENALGRGNVNVTFSVIN